MNRLKKHFTVYELLSGRVATNIADSLFYMVILWYFKETYHDPMIVSLVFAISSGIDMVSFGFGPLIDRVSIKTLLKGTTLLQCLLSLAVAVIFWSHQVNQLFAIVLLVLYILSTIGSSLIYPSEYKLLPVMVPKSELLHFNGLFQVTYQTLDVFLDAGTTMIISFFSVDFTIILSAIFFAIALAFYSTIRVTISAKKILEDEDYFTGSYLKDLLVGWQTLQKERHILMLIVPLMFTNFFYGVFEVGLPYFAQEYLNRAAWGYGALLMASSIGGILGAFLVQQFRFGRKNMTAFIAICFLFAGISRLLVPATLNLNATVMLVFSVVSSLWITMMNTNFEVLVQTSFSSAVLGRVQTINDSILSVMIPVGTLVGGMIISQWGSLITQYIYGVALLLSALYYAIILRFRKE